MAIQNSATIYINGRNYTNCAVMPLKWGNFLDEQLDEMYLSLRHCPIRVFKPLSPVEIHLSNRLYFGQNTIKNKQIIKRYIVANDSNAEENPVGKNLWNHDLYLIELTKIAECFVIDTLTFTNDLGRNYLINAKPVMPQPTGDNSVLGVVYPQGFENPAQAGDLFTFPAPHSVYTVEPSTETAITSDVCVYTLTVSSNGSQIFTETYTLTKNGSPSGSNDTFTTTLQSGQTYTALYSCTRNAHATGSVNPISFSGTLSYTFSVVQNRYPLKKWTMKDVINRVLDLAEPIRKGESPRFQLNTTQAAMFDKILAPQFSFTKSTLRECLQQCGAIVHGEPRLDIAQDSTGAYYYEVSYDLWGQTARSGIYAKKYIQQTVSQVIDSYASCIDSNAENLVNSLDKYSGVIVEPYAGGYKTVRTETMYARITDENMIIPTQYPINTIEKLECGYIPSNTDAATPPIDITPYIFESSIYNTQLSSYEDLYPYSKAYGIMYSQGQKNLTALNFKQDHPISDVFNRYAIINILREVTGDESLDISVGSNNENNYPLLAFRGTYTPFYNSRVGQTKVNYEDYPYSAALIYNQQANVIESRYYGENLKGVIARIGNVEKSFTYILAGISDIPQAGQMFDDDYYISAVSVEFMPAYIKCSLGLSKDFNRLSQYIGISSVKRFSEVSQTQAVERNLLYKEYIVIGDSVTPDSDSLIGINMMRAIADTFTQTGNYRPLTNIRAYGGTVQDPQASEEDIDIKDQTSASFSNSDLTITFTTTVNNDKMKTVIATMVFQTRGGTGAGEETTDVEVHFTGTSITVNAADYNATSFELYQITSVTIWRADYEDIVYPLPAVCLPVIASAFGNSIAYSWEYEDNYSAGAVSQYAEGGVGSNEVTGYFQNNYQYTDYYGKMYYYSFDLQTAGPAVTQDNQEQIGTSLPGIIDVEEGTSTSNYISNFNLQPYVLRKDNREKIQGNVQIDFVTNRKRLIIGSALASYCGAVRGSDSSLAAKLYVFDEPLNKFIDHLEASLDVEFETLTGANITVTETATGQFSITAGNFTTAGKAWAIVTAQTEKSETVEDEEGNITTQTVQYGGDVLLAMNMDISAGDSFTPIYFTKKRKIFKEDVWTAIR